MIIETLTILALGIPVPVDCPKGNLFRRQGVVICLQSSARRGTKAFIPRRVERPTFIRSRNRGYTKVRNVIKKPKVFGNSVYRNRITRISKRTLMQNRQHVLQSRDKEADLARRRAQQKSYSDKRKR